MPSLGIIFRGNISVRNNIYNVHFYDCEPSGLLIIATKEDSSCKYELIVSRKDLAKAKLDKNLISYQKLLSSLTLEESHSNEICLLSTINEIARPNPILNGNTAKLYLSNVPASVNVSKSSTTNKNLLSDLLAKGLTELCREKPVGLDAVQWLGNWLLKNNPNQPTTLN